MARLRSILAGLARLLGRRTVADRDLDRELEAWLETATAERIARGADPVRAAREARVALGSTAAIRDRVGDVGWETRLDLLRQDVGYALRGLRRSPGFALVVILTLAVGIGGNTAIFSLVDTIYFRDLPIPAPGRVVRLRDAFTGPDGARQVASMHAPNAAIVSGESSVFAATTAVFAEDETLRQGDAPEHVSVAYRSAGWTATLGVRPAAGRDFTADEARRGPAAGTAIIGDALWRRHFGGAPGAIGSRLDVGDRTYTVVGIMPPGFAFPYDAQVWVPYVVDPADRDRDFAVFGRLRDGVTVDGARRALEQLTSAKIRRAYPETPAGYAVDVMTLRANLTDRQAGTVVALLSVVGILLLLACVNVANMLLARASTRAKELTLRAMLGASRGRLLQQMLVESLVLAGLGCGFGLLAAGAAGRGISTLIPSNISHQLGLVTPRLDWRVVAFAVGVGLLVALATGAAPALAGWHRSARAMRGGGRGGRDDGPRNRRWLQAFVVAELALSLVLLVGGGVMVESLRRQQAADLGFEAAGLLTASVTPPENRYATGPARVAFLRRSLEAFDGIAGLEAVGATTVNPLGGGNWMAPVIIEGLGSQENGDAYHVNHRLVSPALFEAMRIPIASGRAFTWTDDAAHEPVAIVSEHMATRFWPGQSALGRRLRIAREGMPWITVVGVAGDVRDAGDPGDPIDTWYLPYAQMAASPAAGTILFMARSRPGAGALAPRLRRAFTQVDGTLALFDVSSMDAYYASTLDRQRVGTVMTAAFAAFGLLLAGLGVYGVMALSVAQRAREIGVRLALGATPGGITALVLGRGLRLALLASVIGGLTSLGLMRVLASQVVGVRPLEPAVLGVALLALVAAALAACYLPARRGRAVDPLEAMRAE